AEDGIRDGHVTGVQTCALPISYMTADNITRAADKNRILGCKYVVMASSKPGPGLDGWKTVAEALNSADEQLQKSGLHAGYHNHRSEERRVGKERRTRCDPDHHK